MKKILPILFALSALFGCSRSHNDLGNSIGSPSGSFSVSATINKSKDDPTKYLCIQLHLFNATGEEVHSIQTGASDTMKWALGWMEDSDHVVLYSSDIGTLMYDIRENNLVEIDTTEEAYDRGDQLKALKYN